MQNQARYSSGFTEQKAQQYRIKDTYHGPEVWEIKWHTCWRKTHGAGLVSRQATLVVARNVLTGETKYFHGNRVAGQDDWALRDLLRVAFARWQVEACFCEVKEELGWDNFECRGWRCIHRHLYVTILSGLFCARVRQKLSPSTLVTSGELLTMEQVRRAANAFLDVLELPGPQRRQRSEQELQQQHYHQRRRFAKPDCSNYATSHRCQPHQKRVRPTSPRLEFQTTWRCPTRQPITPLGPESGGAPRCRDCNR